MTPEVSEQGFYKVRGDAIFHMRFEGVSEVHIEGFNNQNVLSGLNLEVVNHPQDADRRLLRVELEHCYQFEASFTAQAARVLSITPYVE